jgi:hypothetical protein
MGRIEETKELDLAREREWESFYFYYREYIQDKFREMGSYL